MGQNALTQTQIGLMETEPWEKRGVLKDCRRHDGSENAVSQQDPPCLFFRHSLGGGGAAGRVALVRGGMNGLVFGWSGPDGDADTIFENVGPQCSTFLVLSFCTLGASVSPYFKWPPSVVTISQIRKVFT